MLAGVCAYWLPKAGNAEEEYEDAFWPAGRSRSGRTLRCAIADGATESSFAGIWAGLLVEAYGHGRLGARRWHRGLEALRCTWRAEVGQKPLPWYAEEKLRQGAFSALLGLTLSARPDGSMTWSALAVGDCCLFQLREEQLVTCFPVQAAGDFNSRPYLVGSVRPRGDEANPLRRSGAALPGDRFLLMSDALACWFLGGAEAGGRPWEELVQLAGADFSSWITCRRQEGALRNDDVTLLVVDVLPSPQAIVPADQSEGSD